MNRPISKILIVGAGWTGRQIAVQCAAHRVETYLTDASEATIDSAIDWINTHIVSIASEAHWKPDSVQDYRNYLHRLKWASSDTNESKQIESIQIQGLSDEMDPLSNFDMVLECVSEQASIKRRVLKQISDRFSADTIVCSNSSYFTPSMLMKYVRSPERYAHFHFHAPIHLSTIVDVACSAITSDEVAVRLCDFAKTIGQHPIRQNKENSGYIYNWLLQSLIKSSLELVDRGIASPEDIDLVWKTITRMPVGPFGIMDTIGLDLVQQVLSNARWVGDAEAMQRLVDVLEPFVQAGELGVKSSKGFFRYDSNSGPTPIASVSQDKQTAGNLLPKSSPKTQEK